MQGPKTEWSGVHADSSLRPYVAFNAELRTAFQAFVCGLEERCRGLVRHQLELATSAYAQQPVSLNSLSLGDDLDDMENLPPAPTQVLHER